MVVAEMLGKFEWEVLEQMPPDEFARWIAYLKIMNERAEREQRRSSGR